MAKEFKLEIECSDLAVEVWFNDLPVFFQNGGMRTKNAIINQWLIDGRNRVEIKLKAIEKIDPVEVNAHLNLNLMDNQINLFSYAWKPGDTKKNLPQFTNGGFVLGMEFGQWVWQQAEILELNEMLFREVNRYLQGVYESLNSGNIIETMNIFRVKAEEQARAYGMAIDTRITEQRRFFESWFSETGWRMQPIDYNSLEYTLCGDKRIIQLNKNDGSNVLQSVPVSSGEMISFPLFITKFNGNWLVIR